MQHLILLHGAVGAKDQLELIANSLTKDFTIHLINFSGHGGEPIPDINFSIKLFAGDVLNYMQVNQVEKANIFGYSMGGYVAMYMAKYHAEKINRVITLATKFYWDERVAAKEIKMLNADTIQQKLPVFAQQLVSRHSPNDWKKVLEKTAKLLRALGSHNTLQPGDYSAVTVPCLILLGDRDKMETLDETVAVYKQLTNAQLGILPNTSHPIEQVNLQYLTFFIKQFLAADFNQFL
jgi:pimeloyl-ACP methyl ester carboxylesterase